jgi:hypothetical protein
MTNPKLAPANPAPADSASSKPTPTEDPQPSLRIIAGNPDAVELAAVTVVLAALAVGGGPEPEGQPTGGWTDLSLRLHRTPALGPNAWRNSAWT